MKLILTTLIILLLVCLLDMPYAYYQIVRFIGLVGFGYLSYLNKGNDKFFIFGALGLLFQPFFKISLGRDIWNIVDVLVSIYLGYLIYKEK